MMKSQAVTVLGQVGQEEELDLWETYYVRVTQVLQSHCRYDEKTRTIVELGSTLTGLRLSFLHRRGCTYLKTRSGGNRGIVLTVRKSTLAEALPRCQKCWPLAKVKIEEKALAISGWSGSLTHRVKA